MANDTETRIERYGTTTTIDNNGGATVNEVFIRLTGPGGNYAYAAIDADELRDAIDKAVGPRKEAKAEVYFAPADTPLPAPGETLEDAGFKPLGWIDSVGLTFDEPESAKPYRPIDRDRLLRHIADIEATLTRRNRQHEEDQERIREVLGHNERLLEQIERLEAKLAAPSLEEQLEALEKVGADQEVVLDPPRLLDTKSARAKSIPAIEVERITSHVRESGSQGFRFYAVDGPFGWFGEAEEVLELGVTAEDFGPSTEARRKEYEDAGLKDWEVELLMGANA